MCSGKVLKLAKPLSRRRTPSCMSSDNIAVGTPSAELFTRGLNLYAHRLDKRYSLTDCVSMIVMRDLDITEVLTNDRDFESEGFVRLIR